MDSNEPINNQKTNRLNINLSWPIIALALLGVIIAMLLIWKPWSAEPTNNDRIIAVQGDATIKAEPDEFVFNPAYDFKDSNKDKALAQVTKKSEEVTSGLKKLGVEDSKIKSSSYGNNYGYYYDQGANTNNYSLALTITVNDRKKAQEVQDYLISTGPLGSVSPQANFSDQKRKDLENRARDEATKDARAKADQSAQNLGFKIGKVKSVEDGANFGDIIPVYGAVNDLALAEGNKRQSLAVQPGENDLNFSVKVTYYLN